MEDTKIISIKITKEDVIKGKFQKTLSLIEGCHNESIYRVANGNSYTADSVKERMEKIRNTFHSDLEELEKSIEIQ